MIKIHVPVTIQNIVNDLKIQNQKLRDENSGLRIQTDYLLNCIEHISKAERERVGLIEETDFQRMQQTAQQPAQPVPKVEAKKTLSPKKVLVKQAK